MPNVRPTTRSEEAIEIRLLREDDLSAALQLVEREQWNQTASDWKLLLSLDPDGCFAAFSTRKLIGTVTAITYGTDLAWIGMMLVAHEYRGRGIGRQLMRTALDYCQRCRIATVKLDATPLGRPLYESFGFIPEDEFQRWQGNGPLEVPSTPGSFPKEQTLRALCSLDREAFYAPRKELLGSLLEDCCLEPALRLDESGRLLGYALARRGARASYIGPIVAVERSLAVSLLDSLVEQAAGKIFVDIRVGGADLRDAMSERGFVKQRDLTRMSLGQRTSRVSELIFAMAGPELG